MATWISNRTSMPRTPLIGFITNDRKDCIPLQNEKRAKKAGMRYPLCPTFSSLSAKVGTHGNRYATAQNTGISRLKHPCRKRMKPRQGSLSSSNTLTEKIGLPSKRTTFRRPCYAVGAGRLPRGEVPAKTSAGTHLRACWDHAGYRAHPAHPVDPVHPAGD